MRKRRRSPSGFVGLDQAEECLADGVRKHVELGAFLLLLTAYAYWIRPQPTALPHMLYQWPGFYIDQYKGNYRTDSLVDLALYLSPVVVWAAIGGWYLSLWDIVRGRREAYHAVPLILVAGFSLAYLYDHFNTPDHLWWIRRFTPEAAKVFNLLAADVGRPLGNIGHNLDFPGLEQFLAQVIDSAVPAEREIRDKAGHWFALRARPFVTLDNKIDGAVLMLVAMALQMTRASSRSTTGSRTATSSRWSRPRESTVRRATG